MRREQACGAALALLGLLGAGCLAGPATPVDLAQEPAAARFAPPVRALDCASSCHEPTVAVDAEGRIFVTTAGGAHLAQSDDQGATWRRLAVPPPGPTGGFAGDNLLQAAPTGRLYFSTFRGVGTAGACAAACASLHHAGIEVAASDDGGETWPIRTWFAVPSSGDLPTTGADRQWLAFGAGERVYLTWKHQQGFLATAAGSTNLGLGLYAAVSDDGGRTFRDVAEVAPHPVGGGLVAGPPVVLADGSLAVAYISYSQDPDLLGLFVARSADEGRTFSRSAVLAGAYPGELFPVLTPLANGTLALAWDGPDDRLLVSFSRDAAASWTAPDAWTSAGEALAAGPWARGGADGSLRVLAPLGDGDAAARLRLYDLRPGAPRPEATDLERVVGFPFRPAGTEYAHFDLDPAGRAHVVGSDRDDAAVFVQREAAPPT